MALTDGEAEQPRPRPTRRQFLIVGALAVGTGAGATGVLLSQGDEARHPDAGTTTEPRPQRTGRVAAVADPPDRAAFAPDEQRCAPYLMTLAAVANSVDLSDTELRGFIHGGWWREPAEPFNARTCELVHTLSWFASHERPWNPYFKDPALLARLDAALGYYLGLQHESGAWPEYHPAEESIAATAFAFEYLTKTLVRLRKIDALPQRQGDMVNSVRRGMHWFLSSGNKGVWDDAAVNWANQVLSGLSGAAQALRHDPDPELNRMMDDRTSFATTRIQSPAGFLYEDGAMDVGYDLSVSLPRIAELHQNFSGEPFLPHVRRLAGWLGLALVPEPDGSGFVVFNSAATRTDLAYLNADTRDGDPRDAGGGLARAVVALRPFYTAAEERSAQRASWRSSPQEITTLAHGEVNPRATANVSLPEFYPSRARTESATARMPVVARRRFTELRRPKPDQDYLFVRRATYYVQAYLGRRRSDLVQGGLSLLWHPRGGTFVHSSSEPTGAWGSTVGPARAESQALLTPAYFDGRGRQRLESVERVNDVEELQVQWSRDDGGPPVTVDFSDGAVDRTVEARSRAVERIPLLLRPDDTLRWDDGGAFTVDDPPVVDTAESLAITRGRVTLRVLLSRPSAVVLDPTDTFYFRDRSRRACPLHVVLEAPTTFRFEFTETENPQVARTMARVPPRPQTRVTRSPHPAP